MELWKKLGCLASLAIWLAVGFPFLFGLAWSGAHCEPVPQCQRASEWHFGLILLGLAVVAGVTGVVIARALSSIASRRDDERASVGFVLVAFFGTLVTAATVIATTYALLDCFSA